MARGSDVRHDGFLGGGLNSTRESKEIHKTVEEQEEEEDDFGEFGEKMWKEGQEVEEGREDEEICGKARRKARRVKNREDLGER